jgi:hypothetical protein
MLTLINTSDKKSYFVLVYHSKGTLKGFKLKNFKWRIDNCFYRKFPYNY